MTAIQICLTTEALFQSPCRAAEGLMKALRRLYQPDLPVPDHTRMSPFDLGAFELPEAESRR